MPRKTSLGVIIRDSIGDGQVSLCCNIESLLQPTLVEALVLRRVMNLCTDLGFSRVIFERNYKENIIATYINQQNWAKASPIIQHKKHVEKKNRMEGYF